MIARGRTYRTTHRPDLMKTDRLIGLSEFVRLLLTRGKCAGRVRFKLITYMFLFTCTMNWASEIGLRLRIIKGKLGLIVQFGRLVDTSDVTPAVIAWSTVIPTGSRIVIVVIVEDCRNRTGFLRSEGNQHQRSQHKLDQECGELHGYVLREICWKIHTFLLLFSFTNGKLF